MNRKRYNSNIKLILLTAIATAAIEMLTGDTSTSRKPEIVSDAAYVMLCK